MPSGCLRRAAEFARSQAEPRDQAECLNEIAGAYFSMAKAEEAQAMIADAQKAADQIQADESHAYALLHIAQKLIAAKRFEEGKKLVDRAYDLGNKVSDSSIRQQVLDDIEATSSKL